jgi:filamentous hemagglutinin family protein
MVLIGIFATAVKFIRHNTKHIFRGRHGNGHFAGNGFKQGGVKNMNHIYRIVWNHAARCWQAVAESAKGFGKGRAGKTRAPSRPEALSGFAFKPLIAALSLISASAWAGPQGGQVTAGSATIQQSGTTTTINQSSTKAAIDWTSFSVGKNESVRFNQPGSNAITLNRVTGKESSQILGSLTANGQVFILNPNGVLFGKGAQVTVGGLVASSRSMSNADFMAGNYQLTGGGTGSVINEGHIQAAEGGVIALIAPVVQNTGTLSAPQGSVLLAAADSVSLKLQDGSLIGYTLDKGSLQALVDNGGLIQAEGGHVILTVKGLDALSRATINHSGVIEAQTVSSKNGVVELLGDMESGVLNLSGKIDASAPNGGNGGFVETSAATVNLLDGHRVTTLASNGATGNWLIDPNDYTIATSGGNITGTQLSNNLANSNITIRTVTQGTAGGHGDINVNAAVNWSANKLTLSAERNININATLNGSGAAQLALEYGQGAVAAGNTADYFINNNATVNLPAGQNFSTKLGSDGVTDVYTVITSLGVAGDTSATTLQGMKNNLSGKYALGADIDASATADWNGGAGWQPIGSGSPFSGVFAGLQHSIDGLSIANSTGGYIGFFSGMSGQVRDARLTNSYITTSVGGWSGILMGHLVAGGQISNSYSSGVIEDQSGSSGTTGGLVGTADSNTTIKRSASSAAVTGNHAAGGLVGFNFALIEDSYATGVVSLNTYAAGGFVGLNNGTILRSYSTGRVTGSGMVGGLVGWAGRDVPSTITDSYWDTESSQVSTSSGGGDGKTTAQMQQQATFANWDFTNTWIIDGASYPALRYAVAGATTTTPPNSCDASSICRDYSAEVDSDRYKTAIIASYVDKDGDSVSGPNNPVNYLNNSDIFNISSAYGGDGGKIKAVADNAIYALLSNNAYHDASEAPLPFGFVQIGPERSIDLIGYSASVYMNKITGEVTVAFRGTDPSFEINFHQDADLLFGGANSAKSIFDAAEMFANDIKREIEASSRYQFSPYFGATSLNFAGHSLGGALATYAGLRTGKGVVTFNSAPLGTLQKVIALTSPEIVSRSRVTNFVSTNDPLTLFDHVALVGSVITVENASEGHSITSLMKSMQDVASVWPIPDSVLSVTRTSMEIQLSSGVGSVSR